MVTGSLFRPLQVPDRFEALLGQDRSSWGAFISPVKESLSALDRLFMNSDVSRRGQLLIVESRPGVGKTTFLNSASIFLDNLEVINIPSNEPVNAVLMGEDIPNENSKRRLFVLEGRESIDHVSEEDLNQLLHQINQRLRSSSHSNVVVAWPCNSTKLADRLVNTANQVGGAALLDDEIGRHHFKGPPKAEFRQIASNTISFLNDGADFVDLGIDEFAITHLLNKSVSIGDLFSKLVREVSLRRSVIKALPNIERYRVWVVVAAGSQPEKEVSGLTRGSYGACDIQRLCNSTQANIVAQVKEYPDKLGLLAGYFDAKVTFVPVVTLLSVIRAFADEQLTEKLKEAGTRVTIADKQDAINRLQDSQLATLIRGEQIGLLSSPKIGTDTKKAFGVLTGFASQNDIPLNRAFAEGLKASGLISDYKLEDDFGSGLTRKTDILASTSSGNIRIEMMWRKETSKADMANYTLTKLFNYGRALGYLKN